ncbi:YhhA family cyclophane-containing RiPP [Mesorhizobium sp. M0578]|uniref:YhhA family cyclophane-containing RiPP n=1 Tax=unclassified Mesorhizobium TaxID=325217 RepID=UPI00333E0616
MRSNRIVSPEDQSASSIDLPLVDSVALQRLIAEVRQQDRELEPDTTLYNRTYHRHNR